MLCEHVEMRAAIGAGPECADPGTHVAIRAVVLRVAGNFIHKHQARGLAIRVDGLKNQKRGDCHQVNLSASECKDSQHAGTQQTDNRGNAQS